MGFDNNCSCLWLIIILLLVFCCGGNCGSDCEQSRHGRMCGGDNCCSC